MSNWLSRLRPYAVALALPVGGIAISYAMVMDGPLRQRQIELQTKLSKISGVVKQRSALHATNLQQLQHTQKLLRELPTFVSTPAPASESDVVVSAEQNGSEEQSSAGSSLARLSDTLELFNRHHIECLASQPVDLSGDAKSSQIAHARRAMRLTFQGSFVDMHRALEEMQSALNCVAIVSLEMEASPARQASHRWIVILQI